MISIVDYGMGNLRSVQKACEKVGIDAEITDDPAAIRDAERLILPGVGAFRDAIAALREQGMVEPVLGHIDSGKPFLGICLGLQLLFDRSYEDGEYEGLGVISGEVIRFRDVPGKIPHMGWNTLEPTGDCPLLKDIPPTAHFYFVHSYYVVPDQESVVAARTEYGPHFASMIQRGNMFATQFHPEKSQSVGLQLLKNFATLPAVIPTP
ncbi:imidazole glycerol phosphate synthase subunit HisH [Calycomorphotria hydatis]|uniref:Imidazole glycerol phosphate synthase subunit HisH n=1 Tax=Calycomorphotria hydatis TaxID=2528027 RepID=A0A517TAF0_9PLAN|nr:imidazole glycerol phosphate synthase subunit HisH [Calycomorphotria hydatis]QDT65346.1 Imidazole glycerol phosphate synthase subunit HisH 1 [Calycomorphotria hydatis]